MKITTKQILIMGVLFLVGISGIANYFTGATDKIEFDWNTVLMIAGVVGIPGAAALLIKKKRKNK